jgi:uncharacterized protein
MSLAKTAIAAAVLCTLAGCAIVDAQQRQWIFQPGQRTWPAGAQAAEGMQDVWIDVAPAENKQPARLHGLWLPQTDADAPTMLYLHGARWDVRSSARRMRRADDALPARRALGRALVGAAHALDA